MKRFRGFKSLVHDAVDATVDLVEEGHESTSRSVRRVTDEIPPLREPTRVVDGIRRLATAGVLGTIRVVNRATEVVTDAGLDALPETEADDAAIPLVSRPPDTAAWVGDAALGLVNAAVGDHLHSCGNGLDMEMQLRVGDRYVALEGDALRSALAASGRRIVVFVHGLGTTEWSWSLEAATYWGDPATNFGTELASDLGFTPLYVRYNSGRHISENGRQMSALLGALVEALPSAPEALVLMGHSMGGLVLSSAARIAEDEGASWTSAVTHMFYLGSPHQGAPLAKAGHILAGALQRVDLPATRIVGRILEGRSAGVKDLRHGALIDEEWSAPHPLLREALPLPHAAHHFVSATVTRDPEHPLGQIIGDLLVRVPSASGPAASTSFDIDIRHHGAVMHHQLQNHPAVYAQVRDALSAALTSSE